MYQFIDLVYFDAACLKSRLQSKLHRNQMHPSYKLQKFRLPSNTPYAISHARCTNNELQTGPLAAVDAI